MNPVGRAVQWMQRWVNLESSDTVCVLGMLPEHWDTEVVFDQLPTPIWADEYPRLSSARRFSKRRIGVLYIGIGQEGRGMLLRERRPNGEQYLTSDWWRGLDNDICLVAYSCHSAPLLRESRTITQIGHAIAYKEAIWLTIDSGEYWIQFLARVLNGFRSADGDADLLYAAVQGLYVSAIQGGTSKPTYLTRQCLVQQSLNIELVYGSQ